MTNRDIILAIDPPPEQFLPLDLDEAKFEIIPVESGRQALRWLKERKPKLVMFRFGLGDMTAAELCRHVRHDSGTRSTSLLFVADVGSDDEVDLCMGAGCNDIIFRPVRGEELESKINILASVPQRKTLRALTRVEFSLGDQHIMLLGHSLNISASGMLLQVNQLLPPEAVIKVGFYLPDDERPLRLQAKVFRAEFDEATPRYGLQFIDIPDADRERIDHYVQQLQMEAR